MKFNSKNKEAVISVHEQTREQTGCLGFVIFFLSAGD
jgi:hypothetical protein